MFSSPSVLKRFDWGIGEKYELEKFKKLHPLQSQTMLLLTNPLYSCVKDPIQLTWYQPAYLDLSPQEVHWMALCLYFTALVQITQGYFGL